MTFSASRTGVFLSLKVSRTDLRFVGCGTGRFLTVRRVCAVASFGFDRERGVALLVALVFEEDLPAEEDEEYSAEQAGGDERAAGWFIAHNRVAVQTDRIDHGLKAGGYGLDCFAERSGRRITTGGILFQRRSTRSSIRGSIFVRFDGASKRPSGSSPVSISYRTTPRE